MDLISLNEKLDKIEKLLLGTKTVLTFDEACDYTGISRSYMYKLTAPGSDSSIPVSKPIGKVLFFDKKLLDSWLLRNSRNSKDQIESKALDYVLNNTKNR